MTQDEMEKLMTDDLLREFEMSGMLPHRVGYNAEGVRVPWDSPDCAVRLVPGDPNQVPADVRGEEWPRSGIASRVRQAVGTQYDGGR